LGGAASPRIAAIIAQASGGNDQILRLRDLLKRIAARLQPRNCSSKLTSTDFLRGERFGSLSAYTPNSLTISSCACSWVISPARSRRSILLMWRSDFVGREKQHNKSRQNRGNHRDSDHTKYSTNGTENDLFDGPARCLLVDELRLFVDELRGHTKPAVWHINGSKTPTRFGSN
jgi:hypothetical protein